MSSKIIYVDMDGVLADFMYHFLQVHNRDDLVERYENGTFPNDWTIEGELGGEENWWPPVRKAGEYFWANLNPYDWSGNIINMVKATGLKWYICTCPHYPHKESTSGKVAWLHKYFGEDFNNIIMIKDKYLLANENTYLIDDSNRNYDKFIAAGGNGFLWPQPWNDAKDQVNDRLSLLKLHLEAFVQEEALVTSN
jgi:5'(3')-deoxyribonucleotidase